MRTSHRGINAIQTGAGPARSVGKTAEPVPCHREAAKAFRCSRSRSYLSLPRSEQALDLDGPDQNSTHDGLGRNKVEPDVAFWKVHTPTVIAHESGDVQFRKIVTLVRRHDSSL